MYIELPADIDEETIESVISAIRAWAAQHERSALTIGAPIVAAIKQSAWQRFTQWLRGVKP